jgi:hypothetical protein
MRFMSEPSPWAAPAPEALSEVSVEQGRERVARLLAAFVLVLATSQKVQNFLRFPPVTLANAGEMLGYAIAVFLTDGTILLCYVWLVARYIVGRRRARRGPIVTSLLRLVTDVGPTLPHSLSTHGVGFVVPMYLWTVVPDLLFAVALVTALAGRLTRARMIVGHVAVGLYAALVVLSWVAFFHG